MIDADGDLDTSHDQFDGVGWEFELELVNGTLDPHSPATQVTDEVGGLRWTIHDDPEGTTATVTEVSQDGSELLDAACIGSSLEGGDTVVGELDGDSVAFQIESPVEDYQCVFYNSPSTVTPDSLLAGISVWKHIDTDGDLATVRDQVSPPTWGFEAVFEDDVEILFADQDANRDEPARWYISHAGDSTRVVLTEVPHDGYRLVKAACIDGDSSDGMEIPTTLEGNSVVFDVSGFPPFVGFPHEYLCDLLNAPVGEAALPTLPPTYASTTSAVVGSGAWRLVVVGLAAFIASVLVLGSHRATVGRH